MKLAIAAEVCSFELMKVVKQHLIDSGHEVIDLGMTKADEPHKFYEIAPRVARAVQKGEVERGVLMCGTGMGVCLVANKFKGIYAGVAESATTARLHYVINRANILCMGGWIVGSKVACDMVDAYLAAKIGDGFNEERRRVQAEGFARIQEIERENFGGGGKR
ncbi:MAG: RpiB/LacA/LacB family sugar-phosphate isomerase [Planctomycetota bacterium]